MTSGFSVSEILGWTSGRLANAEALGERSSAILVQRPSPLLGGGPEDCCFFFSKAYQQEVARAAPGVLITAESFVLPLQASGLPIWETTAIIACPDPYLAMAILSGKFAKVLSSVYHGSVGPEEMGQLPEIHPSAVVHPMAKIENGAKVGPNCVIEEGAELGLGVVLYPGVYIGKDVKVGEGSVLFPGVTLYEMTEIGKRVRIHAGSTLGADGFGYAPIIENGVPVGHRKIYHLGKVTVGDDAEIGANSMVDRSTFGETRIEKNVKIDNHVHVGHNSVILEGAVLCGGVCLAGGTVIGRYAYIGGMAGIGNKAQVGDYAKVGAMSLVDKHVPPGTTAVGNPQRTYREHFKAHALLNRLVDEREKKRQP
ncbi:MAG: UDP-3-O-(3-hydroxymyristoyl)glucosamine N-acyltransferase [Cryobacterium sp.]|nr:UDP-3-O-(3-hydroxymyristoyl)glucosamine N-acyltransferase [Oligoflexia bacterium]